MLASGHPVRCRHGRLSAATPEATVALNARIAAAATNTFGVACRGTEVALPCPNGQVAVARVRPLGCNESGGDDGLNATAVIVMTEPGTLSAPLAALARHFELTPSETRVLEEVIWGKSRKQAAAALGVTDSTVKSHLEKLYAKTGTSGRSHLFQLVTNLSWPVTAGG
ncbi:MAG: helix-turn-helix transcriptional regulator [Hyphomicrobium sp.]